MSTRRHHLPSMTALQILLTIAERGYTTAAAETLNLSQSAVSRQLLGLEELIGGPAFERTARGMVPTPAGRIYLEQAQVAIKAMEDAVLRVARLSPQTVAVRLGVLPIFGDRWLLPRFAEFAERFPEIDVQFTTFVTPTQAVSADGAFVFSRTAPQGNGFYLFGRDVVLAATSDYWSKIGSPQDLDGLARGVMLEHPGTDLHWSHFAGAHGRADLLPRHTIRFGYYTMVIRAALAGQGMALIPRGLIVDELAAGRLVSPPAFRYRSDYGYWFTIPNPSAADSGAAIFADWLRTSLAENPVEAADETPSAAGTG